MILLEIDQAYTKKEEKTHQRFPFVVPCGLSSLVLDLSISPAHDGGAGVCEVEETFRRDAPYLLFTPEDVAKELPLRNFLDVSLDSPEGWIGTQHRHGSVKHIEISEEKSSVGFRPAKITEGDWVLTLSFNAVVTEKLLVKVTLRGEG